MTRENVELVRRSYELRRNRSIGEWIETLDPAIVLDRDLPAVSTVRDRRIVPCRVFKTRAQALGAVELSE